MSSEDFEKSEEIFGLDPDEAALEQVRRAREDRKSGNMDAYVDLDSISWRDPPITATHKETF